MELERTETTLGELGEFRNGANFSQGDYGAGFPIVNVKQLYRGRYASMDDLNELSAHAVSRPESLFLRYGDILFARSSVKASGAGQVAMVGPCKPNTVFSGFIIRFRVNALDRVAPEYLNYLLRSPTYRELLTRIGSGTTITNLSQDTLASLPIDLPPLPKQKVIAAVLGALDDKIELNRRMNATLESMARALFQSWFVDFDPVRAKQEGRPPTSFDEPTSALFPNQFQDSELGQIPKGWNVSKLKELTSKIGSGSTPRGGREVYVDEGPALIRSQNVYDHEFRWEGLARLTEKSATELKNVEVKKHDVLLNITGDSILRTCVVDPSVLPARVNQHVAIIRAISGIPPHYLHLYLVQPSLKSLLLGLSAGATRHAITKGHLEAIDVIHPPANVLAAFEKLTTPWFEQIDNNRIQSRTLASLRDTLLPKLLSGVLTVENLFDAEAPEERDAHIPA